MASPRTIFNSLASQRTGTEAALKQAKKLLQSNLKISMQELDSLLSIIDSAIDQTDQYWENQIRQEAANYFQIKES